jgi:hypothetical protein
MVVKSPQSVLVFSPQAPDVEGKQNKKGYLVFHCRKCSGGNNRSLRTAGYRHGRENGFGKTHQCSRTKFIKKCPHSRNKFSEKCQHSRNDASKKYRCSSSQSVLFDKIAQGGMDEIVQGRMA